MGRIQKLSKELVNLIAAGEVVERPSSVLKELLENAIDAKASKITVYLENYGNQLIEVQDNGTGMSPEDAQLAFELHATSKISSAADLTHIMSLGFRGEALASIGAVAERSEIETKGAESTAALVIFENEALSASHSNITTSGTRVSIRNLFKNIPARRKFLKSPTTELKHLLQTFIEIALPHIDIHFEIYHDNKLQYRLTKTTALQTRILEIWGKKIAEEFYIHAQESASPISVYGLIGKPDSAQKRANIQMCYLNGRYVKSNTVSAAIQQAYHGHIHRDLRTNYILFMKMAPTDVDVNVHPRKLEVKFNNDQEVFQAVYHFVKSTIELKEKELFLENLTSTKQDDTASEIKGKTYNPDKQINLQPKMQHVKEHQTFYTAKSKRSNVEDAIGFTRKLFEDSAREESNLPQGAFQPTTTYTQVFNTYITFEQDNSLIFIDQHAAAEKIAFERIISQVGNVQTKPLLVPEIIELHNSNEKDVLLDKREILRSCGLIIEDFGVKSLQVMEVPEIITSINVQTTLQELLQDDESLVRNYEHGSYTGTDISKGIYFTVATIACHGSIRAGQSLNQFEMKQIVENLGLLRNPSTCPHGRPVMWSLSKPKLEDNFKRNL